jgi:hypothetical protein
MDVRVIDIGRYSGILDYPERTHSPRPNIVQRWTNIMLLDQWTAVASRVGTLSRLTLSTAAITFVMTSCGGAVRPNVRRSGMYLVEPNGAKRLLRQYPIAYSSPGVQTLVRDRLPSGTYLALVAEHYEYRGKTYSELAAHFEMPGKRGVVSSGGGSGPSLDTGRRQILEIVLDRSCVSLHEVVLAFGLLTDARDSVIAQGDGKQLLFQKATIPASFHPDGVLVYALLGQGPVDVVTRAPTGRAVQDEHYGLKLSMPCGRQ